MDSQLVRAEDFDEEDEDDDEEDEDDEGWGDDMEEVNRMEEVDWIGSIRLPCKNCTSMYIKQRKQLRAVWIWQDNQNPVRTIYEFQRLYMPLKSKSDIVRILKLWQGVGLAPFSTNNKAWTFSNTNYMAWYFEKPFTTFTFSYIY